MNIFIPEPLHNCCICCENALILKNTKHAYAAACECVLERKEKWCMCEYCQKCRHLAEIEDNLE